MSSCSLSYLGGVFDRAATISCDSDAVTDPVTGWIITPLPHNIAQLLTSPHLNCNHSICRRRCPRFVVVVLVLVSLLPSLFVVLFLFPPLEMQSTLCIYAHIVVSIGKEGYQSSSALAVTINTLEVAEYRLIFLGGGWPDDVWFPRISGDSPPLIIVWAEDASIMWQTLMM
jgi:hypothetical protein